jgi:hypothetical protein
VGDLADVSLAATGLPDPADAPTDASAQRHRGLANDAQDGVAEVLTANPLTRFDRGGDQTLTTFELRHLPRIREIHCKARDCREFCYHCPSPQNSDVFIQIMGHKFGAIYALILSSQNWPTLLP